MRRGSIITYVMLSSIIIIGLLLVGMALLYMQRTEGKQVEPVIEAVISPEFPADIFTDGTLAREATITEASIFAWQEFVALNWPAMENTRDTPDPDALFGEPDRAVVWQTHRSKVEIFPGAGNPPGYEDTAPDYGYYQMPPVYNYSSPIAACDPAQENNVPPLINLDERGQIIQDTLHAGVYAPGTGTDNQLLYTAKGNHVQYIYLVSGEVYINSNNPNLPRSTNNTLFSKTADYVLKFNDSPPAGTDTQTTGLFSFPSGIIENKASWRRLTPDEVASRRFFMAVVRYYEHTENGGAICFRDSTMTDDVWGLVSLHIIHKTPTAPYFTFATFSQADDITDPDGNAVEDENGNVHPQYQDLSPFEPDTESTLAHVDADGDFVLQSFNTMVANCTSDDKRLRFVNTTEVTVLSGNNNSNSTEYPFATPQGVTCINRRIHPIPDEVIAVNTAFHEAIGAYNAENNLENSPWMYYKLVNIQWRPIDKPAGVFYTGEDVSTYYLTNTLVESNYNLQLFSGTSQFDYPMSNAPFLGLGTDFAPIARGINPPLFNVQYQGDGYNMGGCMGCHGLVQRDGADFSFMTQAGPVCEPEVAGDSETFFLCIAAP